MKKGKITLVPDSGLANRMRAILSAHALCTLTGSDLAVVWLRDRGLNAKFSDLFQPSTMLSVADGGLFSKCMLQAPLKRNLYLPAIYQRICFDALIYDWTRPANQADYKPLVSGKNVYICSGLEFFDADYSLTKQFFKPVPEIQAKIDANMALLGPNPVGVHIRRTDNAISIANSPVSLFIEAMKKHPDSKFFLATDDEDVKSQLRAEFAGRIVTSSAKSSRSSKDGMVDAVVDLFTLASTSYVIGSYWSSFSDIAIAIAGQGEIINKERS